jgi:hypothetical protein
MRLPGFRSAPSCSIAFGIGLFAAVAYLCRWPPQPPDVWWRNLDPGCYYRMAQQPFQAEHLPFVLRPAVPLLLRLLPVPTAWRFAGANLLGLGLLCALVERLAARLGRPPLVGIAAGAVVCATNPVWKAFYLRATIDLPVLCLIAGVVLLLLSERLRAAWFVTVASGLAHPLGLLMSAAVLMGRSWRAGLSAAATGAGLAGLYALLIHPRFLPVADRVAVGFKAVLAANGPSPARILIGALAYGIGPLVIGYARAPFAYRRILVPVTGAVLAAMAGGSDWIRFLAYLCPLLLPVALPSPPSTAGRSAAWGAFAGPVGAAVILMALFLLPTTVPDLNATRPNKLVGECLLLLGAALLVPWRPTLRFVRAAGHEHQGRLPA